MRPQDVIAQSLVASKQNFARYLAGFDDSNQTRQAPHLPNHAAWNLGHCALTMHRARQRIAPGSVLPDSDFIGGGTAHGGGDARRFAVESVSFGSSPVDDRAAYPGFARGVEIFEHACEALAQTMLALPDAELEQLVEWGSGTHLPKHQMAMRMVGHNGMHAGQIADLRRALGFKSIFS